MRRVASVVAVGLFALPVFVSAQGTHLEIREPAREAALLKGPVKSVETDTTINVSGKHLKELEEYDEVGNLVVDSNWDSDGELINTATNFYDEDGCFYRHLYIDLEEGITNDWKVVLRPETHQIAMKNGRTGMVTIRTYSPKKQLIHYRRIDKKKKLISASRNKRNEKGERTEYIKYDKRNKPLYTYYFKWKENGLIDKERQHYHQEKKERLHTYEYLAIDEHGNWTQRLMVRYDIGGKKKENVYEKTTVRTIKYFEEEEPLAEAESSPEEKK
jgi:hypothetical protein